MTTSHSAGEIADRKPMHILKASQGWVDLDLLELWDFRELIWILARRDIAARYRQTEVGMAWAIIQPVLMMMVCTLIFSKMAGVSSDGGHYSLFFFAAILPWQFFSAAVSKSSTTLVDNVNLLTKVYFPRLCMPVAAVILPLVDLAAGFIVLIPMLLFYRVIPGWQVVFLPLFILMACVSALGVGLWLSAATVEYRDLHHVLPFLIQLWMFASPVVYSKNMVPAHLKVLYGINPMSGVITGFRWCLINGPPPGIETCVSAAVALLVLITGAYFFRRTERTFADLV